MTDADQTSHSNEPLKDAILILAIESWRISRVFYRLLTRLDVGERKRFESQVRWYTKRIEEAMERADMRIVDVEGHPFDPGMAATPLNIDEFDASDSLIVDQMLEPIVMANERLVKTGTVTLRKVEQ